MSAQLMARQAPDSIPQKPIEGPTAEDFKGQAVANAVLKESLAHPATIYPLVCSALALGWTAIIAPTPISLAVSFGLAFVGGSAFVFNYIVKGPERAAAYVARLREQRRTQALQQLDLLLHDCQKLGFADGAKEARELKVAYEDLARYLKEHKDGISADRFRLLAEDSLRQGISTLDRALAIFRAIESIDAAELRREVEEWKNQQEKLDRESARFKSLNQQIESHSTRISLYTRENEKLTELMAESNKIESALQSTYLQLVDMGSEDVDEFLSEDGGAANRLKNAVEIARRVEQRLRGGEDLELESKKSKYLGVQEHPN